MTYKIHHFVTLQENFEILKMTIEYVLDDDNYQLWLINAFGITGRKIDNYE